MGFLFAVKNLAIENQVNLSMIHSSLVRGRHFNGVNHGTFKPTTGADP